MLLVSHTSKRIILIRSYRWHKRTMRMRYLKAHTTELKIGAFKAEYVGKMNLYLSLLDRLEKGENENPSIGIILCADKDHLDVEIALQDINKPIGVAEYQLLLPKDELQALLIKEINSIEENIDSNKE